MATLALGVEMGYTRLMPSIPPVYAALIRAAVWDCVLVGVLVAQMVDLASTPLLAGTDGGHYLPLAVLLYHALTLVFCAAFDACSHAGVATARSWHHSLVCRRVLLELAGGASGAKLYLGRVCFVVSGAVIGLALRVLLWVDDGTNALTCFIVLLFVAYCAAGLAASEVRHTLPGHLVQWLCTGWAAREALVQGPLKIIGGLFLMPFAASVIAAQIWLRTLAFIVWLAVGCPCCRLQRADNVYDAFERELAVPLLQCSFLAFAGALAAIVLGANQLSSVQRMAVGSAAIYYTGMLTLWAAPAVLQAKVAAEEAFHASTALGEDGQVRLLSSESPAAMFGESDIELEDVHAACDELRALLRRERHDHSVELAQLQGRLKDHELRIRAADRERAQAEESLAVAKGHAQEWQERCSDLQRLLAAQLSGAGTPQPQHEPVSPTGAAAAAASPCSLWRGGGSVDGEEAGHGVHGESAGRAEHNQEVSSDTSGDGEDGREMLRSISEPRTPRVQQHEEGGCPPQEQALELQALEEPAPAERSPRHSECSPLAAGGEARSPSPQAQAAVEGAPAAEEGAASEQQPGEAAPHGDADPPETDVPCAR